ncbi:MAG: hypothetical protein IJK26_00120 [Clostridia bacterium]|nr:hypothetical protein [Clostridia bacterium]
MPKTNNPVPIMTAPPADMHKAFQTLINKSKQIILEGYRYVNRMVDYGAPPATPPDPSKIELSYYQPSQALVIKDRNINVMITCKYNVPMEGYGLVDQTYIRPIDGAPQGIGIGYLDRIGYADGTQIVAVMNSKARELMKTYDGEAREYTGHFADALLTLHTDEGSGIPRTHDADILRPHTHDDIDDI